MLCGPADCDAMMLQLFQSAQAMAALVENQFGCHIAKSILKRPGAHLERVSRFLDEAKPLMQKSKYGRRFLEEITQLEL